MPTERSELRVVDQAMRDKSTAVRALAEGTTAADEIWLWSYPDC